MDTNEALGAIARTYEELNAAKARKRELNETLKAETKNHSGFAAANEEVVNARNKMKVIKLEVLATVPGLEDDMNEWKLEVKQLQTVLDDLVANAIAEGFIKPGSEVTLGGVTVTPTVRVSMKQMSMGL